MEFLVSFSLAVPAAVYVQEPSLMTLAPHLKGEFVDGGITCPLFRTEDGRVFALIGIDTATAQIGKKAKLWGQEAMFSTCQQGEAFAVERFELESH